MKIFIENKRIYSIFLMVFIGLLTAFGPFVTDMYLSALPSLIEQFNTSASMVQLSLTTCMIGLAVGQLVFGPMSDRYGRKPILLLTLGLFIISTMCCFFSFNIMEFVISRLFQGIAAAGSIVIARSICTDLYTGHELTKIIAITGSINGIAPVLAPVIGGAMTDTIGWKGIFAVLFAIGMVLLFACKLYKESIPVERRIIFNLSELPSYFLPLLKIKPFTGHMLQLGFAQAALFANIASAPFIMQQHYGFTPLEFSLFFGVNALVLVISASLAAKFKRIEYGVKIGNMGLLVFSIIEMVALFMDCNFVVYECGILGILFFLGLCFTSSTTIAMDSGRHHSGFASALLGAVSFAFGGVVSPLVGIGNPMKATGIVFVVCAICSSISIFLTKNTTDKTTP